MRGARTPLLFLAAWFLLEVCPAFVSPFLGDDAYSTMYFLTEDWASVCLAAALYFGLSYTSTTLKMAAFVAVVLATFYAVTNLAIIPLDDGWGISLIIASIMVAAILAAMRFVFMDGGDGKPEDGHIYLIIRKPHTVMDLLGLFYSGIGGGFVAYHDGNIWKFKKSAGVLVKEPNALYYTGKRMIDCGPATPEMLADLDGLLGARWSIFNNCFTVFAGWRRKWRV